MENNVDLNEEIKYKNQEMLLNKKKSDLEKSMESLVLFFKFYTLNAAIDINNKICEYQNINSNSEQAEIYYKTIISFFEMTSDKLKNIIDNELSLIENKIEIISETEYNNELKIVASNIKNKLLDFFIGINKEEGDNTNIINMLVDELSQNVNEEERNKIYKYLYDIISTKMINILNDNLMISIQLISNNNKENQEVMERINERTIKN